MAAKKKAEAAPIEPLRTYGCPVDPAGIRAQLGSNAQFFYDQWAFAWKIPIDQGAPPRVELFKRVANGLVPGYFEWHPWTMRLVDAVCHNQFVAVSGCAGSAKSWNMAGIACAWWLCDPLQSSVIFCSTTAKALRKRGWANVQTFHTSIPGPRVGNFVDSRMLWQARQGDDKHAVMGIAVEEGPLEKIADNIKGVHTQRQMVVIDEATAVPAAIYDACTNLYSYPREFILVLVGNMRTWLDQFGKFAEPDKGITSVTVEDEEWETKPQINGVKGICIRFDVEKSPNLDCPEDKPVSKHLPSHARVRALRNNPGYCNTPQYWSNERGFPPPEGLSKHVFSAVSIETKDAAGRHEFTGNNFQIIGAFDHARDGGDRPTLRFGALGEIESGDLGLEWMPPIIIPLNVNVKNPINYQILEQVRRECESVNYRGSRVVCPPRNLGIDATGGGADLCDIFNREWSYDIIRVGFGESASEDACSNEDIRPAHEVYRNRRAEMYFRTAQGIDSGQIKGIDDETKREMVTIDFDNSKPKIVIVKKEDYKKVFGKSPDLTDSAVILTEVARRKGFRVSVRGQTAVRAQEISETVQAAQAVYADIDYAPEEEPEPVESFV